MSVIKFEGQSFDEANNVIDMLKTEAEGILHVDRRTMELKKISLLPLINLIKDTDLDTFKNTISARIKKLNEDKKSIAYKIDELNSSIVSEVDLDALAFRKRGILGGITSVEEKLIGSFKLSQGLLKEKGRLCELIAVNKNILELKAKKEELVGELEEVNNSLGIKEQNVRTKAKIVELKSEEGQLAERIAELEEQKYLCEKYIKIKVELLEVEINNDIKLVRFKLFNALGNWDVKEYCEALIDEVPFSNPNTASKINSAIDIKEEPKKELIYDGAYSFRYIQ